MQQSSYVGGRDGPDISAHAIFTHYYTESAWPIFCAEFWRLTDHDENCSWYHKTVWY